MSHKYVPCMIILERSDYQIVRRMAEERGLGNIEFSAAICMIIREWQAFQRIDPVRMTADDLHRILVEMGIIDRPNPS